jgi:inorganic pyrophosphatase
MGRIVFLNSRNLTATLSSCHMPPNSIWHSSGRLEQPNQSRSSLSLQDENLRINRAEHDMTKKAARSLANPTRLKPVDKSDGIIQVIIETPKGSRNKFAFDAEQNVFTVKKVLPAGMSFPYDFGFLPRTLAPDGDPIDVLLLMDEPAFPGIAVRARLIGIIEGEQTDGKKKIRNDRLIAVAEMNHEYAYLKKLDDLPKKFLRELEEFFVNYHRLEGKKYTLLACKKVDAAMRMIRKAQRAA